MEVGQKFCNFCCGYVFGSSWLGFLEISLFGGICRSNTNSTTAACSLARRLEQGGSEIRCVDWRSWTGARGSFWIDAEGAILRSAACAPLRRTAGRALQLASNTTLLRRVEAG